MTIPGTITNFETHFFKHVCCVKYDSVGNYHGKSDDGIIATFNQKHAYEREQVTAVRIQSKIDSLQIRRTSFLI
jgi:hypothetical protein